MTFEGKNGIVLGFNSMGEVLVKVRNGSLFKISPDDARLSAEFDLGFHRSPSHAEKPSKEESALRESGVDVITDVEEGQEASKRVDGKDVVKAGNGRSGRIDDAGEKIGGARKDIARSMSEKININGKTFGTIFKKFDLRKLVGQGLDVKLAAGIKFIYDDARARFKKNKRINEIRFIANYAKGFLLGDTSMDYSENGMVFTEYGKKLYEVNTELFGRVYDWLGDDMFDLDLGGFSIDVIPTADEFAKEGKRGYVKVNYYRDGKEIDARYVVKIGGTRTYFAEHERAEAEDHFMKCLKDAVDYKESHPYKLSVYYERGKTDSYFIGTKIGGKVVELTPRGKMYTHEYIDEHNAELQAAARRIEEQRKLERKNGRKEKRAEVALIQTEGEKGYGEVWATEIGGKVHHVSEFFYFDKKRTSEEEQRVQAAKEEAHKKADALLEEYEERKRWKPEMNLGALRSRVGTDWRKGRHVRSEEILLQFGFRGIEFGNYVTQKERQQYLDECYDALMDLSDLLGIPPRGLSLDGGLSLAIGARGLGNAAAHYEPSKNVINLTKKKGAGTLAHEWWHALDFYFGEKSKAQNHLPATGKTFDYITRQEVRQAIERLSDLIHGSDYFKRSSALDSYTGKNYYSTDTELAARAFQDYVTKRLIER